MLTYFNFFMRKFYLIQMAQNLSKFNYREHFFIYIAIAGLQKISFH